MIKKFLAAIAAVTLLGFAAPAPAQAAYGDCFNYPGTICLAAHANWGNPVWRQYPWEIDGCRALTGFNDITTMARNGSSDYSLWIYEHSTCTGDRYLIGSGQSVDFSGSFRNDEASGVRVTWHG